MSSTSTPAQPDRLGAQVVAGEGGRAGGEHQVDHRQHGPEPVGQVGVAGHPVGDAGVADLALGAHQPLRHRRLGHQERVGDLLGGQPAEQPERERHLRLDGQRRVAAGEHEPEPVVAHGPHLHRFLALVQQGGLGVPVVAGRLAAQPVDRLALGRGDDPAGRAGREPVRGPVLHGRDERVLHRLLGDVEVAEGRVRTATARPCSARNTPRDRVLVGPTSSGTAAPRSGSPVATASLPPQSRAASRSSASMIVNPPRCSLRLDERAVGGDHVAVLGAQHGRGARVVQAARVDPDRRRPSWPGRRRRPPS